MVEYKLKKIRDPKHVRMAVEHQKVDELCSRTSKISYEVVKSLPNGIPTTYRIFYKVKSIIGIDEDTQMPIYNDEDHQHVVEIKLPPNFPGPESNPICFFKTEIWHPNIQFHKEKYKGRVCYTSKAYGAWLSLPDLIVRMGEMLQYKNYLAENVDPYPEDETVARWVRDFAVPQGLFNKEKKQYVDNEPLLDPMEGVEIPPPPPPKPVISIKIGGIKKKPQKQKTESEPLPKKTGGIQFGDIRKKR